MGNLNLVKPISVAQKRMAEKCHWKNMADIPVRKNLLPQSFVGVAKLEPYIPTISTKLNPNNVYIMELVMGNDKFFHSNYVRNNLSEILNIAKTDDGSKLIQKILTPENVAKLDYQMSLVKRKPRLYLKDKAQVKYLSSPAGISALFGDLSLLKAADVLDKQALDRLFKMDITEGLGHNMLDFIGRMNIQQLNIVKANNSSCSPLEQIFKAASGMFIVY